MSTSIRDIDKITPAEYLEKMVKDRYKGMLNDLKGKPKSTRKASTVIDKDAVKKVEEIPFKFDEEFCQKVLNKFPDNKEVEEALEKGNIDTIDFFLNERLNSRTTLDIHQIDNDYLDRGLKGFEELRAYIFELKENLVLKEDFREIVRNSRPKEDPTDFFARYKDEIAYNPSSGRFGNIITYGTAGSSTHSEHSSVIGEDFNITIGSGAGGEL